MKTIGKNFKILFLSFVVLGTYYPSLFSGFNLVDDMDVFSRLQDTVHYDILGFFRAVGGDYYRPLTSLTFLLDKVFWGLDPSFMHLENVVLHVLNAVLVFLIAENIFTSIDTRKFELPLLSALLFALHPINTETVNWISGRYDLLATLFVLISTILIQKGVNKLKHRYFILSSLFLLLGCFAKESVVFFFPAALFLVLSMQSAPASAGQTSSLTRRTWTYAVPFAVALVSYFLVRIFASKAGENGLVTVTGQIAQGITHDYFDTARLTLKVFGFYVKKLFMPMPLNFAIVSVSDAYLVVGLISVLFSFYLMVRRTIVTDYLLISFFLISSGIVVVFAHTAWTPVAERYLYLSSAFFSIAVIGITFLILKRYHSERWITIGTLIILACLSYVTVQRSMVWQNNLSLYEDTLRKSPEFKRLKNELASALKEKGRFSEADAVLTEALKENPGQISLYINQADLRLKEGKPDEARAIILKVIKDKKSANAEALKMLATIDEERLFNAPDAKTSIPIARDLIETYDAIYPKTGAALCLYRNGQLLLLLGRKQDAAGYFRKAKDVAPSGSFIKIPSEKLAEKLGATVR